MAMQREEWRGIVKRLKGYRGIELISFYRTSRVSQLTCVDEKTYSEKIRTS